MEDIMEELVGDIQDEFDRLPRHVHSLSGGTWMFGGGVPVAEVVAKLGGSPVSAGGTLAAWLERQLASHPNQARPSATTAWSLWCDASGAGVSLRPRPA
jgi:putative hemolysin